jgi:adenylate cyclase
VNIGDVVQDGDRIYGEGVNIAARIESLADVGGICLSRNTYDHIKNKLQVETEYLGEHKVKNIKDPVRVYRVLLNAESPKPLVEEQFELPDKPSIAVLSFTNMSGDPGQEYFSDGLTEQIINGLCKMSNLFVIARNSSFAYKGKPVSVKQIAKELGVRYILEGSVQKAGDRVRITAQLIDATTDFHMWSETYDRDLEDIFALQDEITMKLIEVMQVKVTFGEQAHLWKDAIPTNIKPYDKFMRGLECFYKWNKQGNYQAKQYCEESIALDPKFPMPYVIMGFAYFFDLLYGWSDNIIKTFELANKAATKALNLNQSFDLAHSLSGFLSLYMRQHNQAVQSGEKAIALNPNGSQAHVFLACIYWNSGKPSEAVPLIEKAFRLDPIPPPMYFPFAAMAYRMNGNIDASITMAKKALKEQPDQLFPHLVLAACYSELGMLEKAKATAVKILTIDTQFSTSNYAMTLPFKNQEDVDRYINALRKAGLPD